MENIEVNPTRFTPLPRRALAGVALAAAAAACPLPAAAQGTDWPARPVTIVVPSSPGGGTDAYGRIVAQALTEQLKQTLLWLTA
jgi:tripartite-type tricarboxylate transporter receptor subunit TctC